MAYQPHLYLTFGGTLGSSEEQWQCGLRFVLWDAVLPLVPITPVEGNAAQLLTAVEELLPPLIESEFMNLSDAVNLEWAKTAAIGADGEYMFGSDPAIVDYDPVVTGDATGGANPYSASMVLSFNTTNSRGLASRGRMYLPLPAHPTIQSSGKYADTGVVAAQAAFVINSLSVGIDDSLQATPAVLSLQDAAYAFITEVRVGDVMDTQRRRRRQLVESYAVEPVE